jgi:hypothetical protein
MESADREIDLPPVSCSSRHLLCLGMDSASRLPRTVNIRTTARLHSIASHHDWRHRCVAFTLTALLKRTFHCMDGDCISKCDQVTNEFQDRVTVGRGKDDPAGGAEDAAWARRGRRTQGGFALMRIYASCAGHAIDGHRQTSPDYGSIQGVLPEDLRVSVGAGLARVLEQLELPKRAEQP